MSPHQATCERGRWLVGQPKKGLFWVVLFGDGPACTCRPNTDCSAAEQSPTRDG